MALALAVLEPLGAQAAEGDGVAAGLGEEVAAEAEAVRPLGEPEVPGGLDHPPVVRVAAQRPQVALVADAGGREALDLQGLGGVLGDVVRDRRLCKHAASTPTPTFVSLSPGEAASKVPRPG